MEQAELALIHQAQAGDREAQGRLYQQHVRILLGYLYHKLGSIQVAEDVCQETFLRAFKSIHTYTGAASFKNWLFQIAKNLMADYWKAHYKFATLSFEEFFENTDLGGPAETVEEPAPDLAPDQVEAILSELSEEYRSILELRFLRGYSLQESADELHISLSNAKIRQFRAIKNAQHIAQALWTH